ncbi:unnamed protein product, partial [Schistosoma turkestanicum]
MSSLSYRLLNINTRLKYTTYAHEASSKLRNRGFSRKCKSQVPSVQGRDLQYDELSLNAAILIKQSELTAFLDSSIASGEVFNFLRFCDSVYKESRTPKGFQRGYVIQSSLVYEKLANHYAKS